MAESSENPGNPLMKRKTKTAARVTRMVRPDARATRENRRSPRPNRTPVYGPGMTGPSTSSRSGGVVLTALLMPDGSGLVVPRLRGPSRGPAAARRVCAEVLLGRDLVEDRLGLVGDVGRQRGRQG